MGGPGALPASAVVYGEAAAVTERALGEVGDMRIALTIEEFVALEGVSDKTKAKILWDNCARLYKLNGSR